VEDVELVERYGVAGLVGFWRLAVEALEGGRSAFSVVVEDAGVAAGLSVVLHKVVSFPARRQVSLVRLDEHLRLDGTSLVEVLRVVHGRAVGVPVGQLGWRSRWLAQVRRYDGIPAADFDGVVARADEVLAVVLAGGVWGSLDDPAVRKVVRRAVALDRGVAVESVDDSAWSAGGAHQGG
jgi:hypothetical protein